MAYQSEQLEQEVEAARWRLQATLEELRTRVTPGLVIDQVIEYARQGPARRFFRSLAREVQENPMPLVLLGISIAWLVISASRSSRAVIATAADSVSKKAAEIGTATGAAIDRTTDAAARLASRIGEAGEAVGKRTADLAARTRDAAGGLAERAQDVSAMTAAALGDEDWPLAGAPESGCGPAASEFDHGESPAIGKEEVLN
jgi:Protein of unknown function (DUF3618)